MYCEKCGAELEDDVIYCSQCGASVDSEKKLSEKESRKNKKWQLLLLLIPVIVMVIIGASERNKEANWKEQFALGERYLLEENYEEAIVAFTEAIKIDPQKASAYLGRGEAYAKSDGTDNLDFALEDYEKALFLDNTLEEGYLGIADVFIRQREFNRAIDILKEGAEKAEDNQKLIDKLENAEKGYMTDSSGKIILPLQAEDLNWLVEPTYDYEDVEPIYGYAFSDVGVGSYSDGTEDFFDGCFSEMSFPSYSNLPEYYNLRLEDGSWKIFYMPQRIEYKKDLEGAAFRWDGSGLDGWPVDDDLMAYIYEETPWDVLTVVDRGNAVGDLYFDSYSGRVFFYASHVPWGIGDEDYYTCGIKPIEQLGLHKPYPVGKMDTSSLNRVFSGEYLWDFEEEGWDIDTSLYAYADPEGKMITDFLYEKAEAFSDGIAACCKNGKWGYIDETGAEITEFVYDAPWKIRSDIDVSVSYPCTSDTMIVSEEEKTGVLYRDGRILIDYGQFEDLAPAWDDQLWAKQDGKWGLIDLADAKQKAGLPVRTTNKGDLESTEKQDSDIIYQKTDWKQAYIDYLQSIQQRETYDQRWTESGLLYVDNDDIPELYIEYPSMAEGAEICTFYNGEIQIKSIWPECSYIEKENLLHEKGGRMGNYYDSIYQIVDGEFIQLDSGECEVDDPYDIRNDEEGNILYDYFYWNGERTSEEEYRRALNSVCDEYREINISYDERLVTLDKMVETIRGM